VQTDRPPEASTSARRPSLLNIDVRDGFAELKTASTRLRTREDALHLPAGRRQRPVEPPHRAHGLLVVGR
jgi:hypothetical protein